METLRKRTQTKTCMPHWCLPSLKMKVTWSRTHLRKIRRLHKSRKRLTYLKGAWTCYFATWRTTELSLTNRSSMGTMMRIGRATTREGTTRSFARPGSFSKMPSPNISAPTPSFKNSRSPLTPTHRKRLTKAKTLRKTRMIRRRYQLTTKNNKKCCKYFNLFILFMTRKKTQHFYKNPPQSKKSLIN